MSSIAVFTSIHVNLNITNFLFCYRLRYYSVSSPVHEMTLDTNICAEQSSVQGTKDESPDLNASESKVSCSVEESFNGKTNENSPTDVRQANDQHTSSNCQNEQTDRDSEPNNEHSASARKRSLDEVAPNSEACNGASLDARLLRQLEYYLGDKNLRTDEFFNRIISDNPEGWLPFENILCCKRIIEMNVSIDDIKRVVANSNRVEFSEQGVRRKNNVRPPPLQSKRSRSSPVIQDVNMEELHKAGLFLILSGVPSGTEFMTLKTALTNQMISKAPEVAGCQLPQNLPPVHFVSERNDDGHCYVYLTPFQNDRELIATIPSFIFNDAEITVSVIEKEEDALVALNKLPRSIYNKRQSLLRKDMNNMKTINEQKPVTIAGCTFNNAEHLKVCLHEILYCFDLDSQINTKTDKLIRELLSQLNDERLQSYNFTKIVIGEDRDERVFVGVKENNERVNLPILTALRLFLRRN